MAWQLWRQDDNGNRYLVGDFASRELAESSLSDLTRSHHKQTYWISENADSPDTHSEDIIS
jgi:hypothetical protein